MLDVSLKEVGQDVFEVVRLEQDLPSVVPSEFMSSAHAHCAGYCKKEIRIGKIMELPDFSTRAT